MKQQSQDPRPRTRDAGCYLLVVLCLMFFAGCSKQTLSVAPAGEYAPAGIKTICLVEPHNKTTYPQVSGQVTDCLYQAIQKKHLFTLSVLKQTDPVWKNLPVQSDSFYTYEQLSSARKLLGVDAVIVGIVTSYSPYPNMAIGIQLKLIDLRDARVCWSVDHVWDTSDKKTESQIKKYFEKQLRNDYSPLNEELAVLSSLNFLKFVTYDIAETFNP